MYRPGKNISLSRISTIVSLNPSPGSLLLFHPASHGRARGHGPYSPCGCVQFQRSAPDGLAEDLPHPPGCESGGRIKKQGDPIQYETLLIRFISHIQDNYSCACICGLNFLFRLSFTRIWCSNNLWIITNTWESLSQPIPLLGHVHTYN